MKLAQADTLCLFSVDSSVVAELGDINDDGQSLDMTFVRDASENTSIRKSTGFVHALDLPRDTVAKPEVAIVKRWRRFWI